MGGDISKDTQFNFKSFMFTQKASQIGANTTLGNSLKTLQVFVKQKEENTEWSLAKKSKASLFLNNENFT